MLRLIKLFIILISITGFCQEQNPVLRGIIVQQKDNVNVNPDLYYTHPVKAFPTAQGGGSEATGGRGLTLGRVTSTSTGVTGSFNAVRACYEGSLRYLLEEANVGPIIFAVSGKWNVSEFTFYYDNNDNIRNKFIVGSTAPRPGVIIYGGRWRFVENSAGNFIMRGITHLYGTTAVFRTHSGIGFSEAIDGPVIYSDCTTGWAWDQAADISGKKVTKQRVLHIECGDGHNTGGIIGENTSTVNRDADSRGRLVSSHHNLYSLISHRFDNAAGEDEGRVDIINNVAYNYQSRMVRINCDPNLNHINNMYMRGPNSPSSLGNNINKWSPYKDGNCSNCSDPSCDGVNRWCTNEFCDLDPKIYTAGNIVSGLFTNPLASNKPLWQVYLSANGFVQYDPLPDSMFATTMHDLGYNPITIDTANEAKIDLVDNENVGARYYASSTGEPIKYFPDFIHGYIEDAQNGTTLARRSAPGSDDISGYVVPTLDSATSAYTDSDFDGMPDAWETTHGLNPNDRTDALITTSKVFNFGTLDKPYLKPEGMENREVYFAYIHGDYNQNMTKYYNQ